MPRVRSRATSFFSPMKFPRIHRHCAALFVAAILITSLRAAEFKLEPGFVSLFNGKDLTGWSYSAAEKFDGKAASTDGRFSAKGGVFFVHPKEPRLAQKIWTTREFPKDFVLKLEFRAAVNADSGIFIRKPQLQCRDYLVAGPDKYKTLKKYRAQDWNEIEIVVKEGVARCTCNGEVLEEALKVPATGPIGLEADRGLMEYRRIRIKETP
ncbi:MAG: DUF1080 domain-containing protein [Opitutus sp.]|nr:DUF1080 domain-containing protein [Opitutus sp.]